LERYIEFDRNNHHVPGKDNKYLNKLGRDIKKNGLKHPITLAVSVSKKTGRAYVYEGNHRMAIFINFDVEWVPVKIIYFFLGDDNDEKYAFIPNGNLDKYPDYPKPSDMGFICRELSDSKTDDKN